MNRKLWILLALLSASVVTAQAAEGAASTCKAPTLTPDANARYDEMDPASRPDRFVDMSDQVSATYINQELSVAPRNTKLLVARGYSNAQAHLRKAAERDFKAALAANPKDEHTYLSYGWALFEMGDDACAITQLQKAAAMQGGHPAWLPQALAESYWRMGRHALALRW